MDNRGSARRGHPFEAPIHRAMGTVEVRDQEDGVRFVAQRFADRVDARRVGVTGSSYGGYMTLRCLTEAPATFHAGVAVAPVTDWDGYDTCYTERYMATPATNPVGYRESSVLAHAGQVVGSLLIIHGMIDENVHFRHSARLVAAPDRGGAAVRHAPPSPTSGTPPARRKGAATWPSGWPSSSANRSGRRPGPSRDVPNHPRFDPKGDPSSPEERKRSKA